MKNIISRQLLIALSCLSMSHALANTQPIAPTTPNENLRKIEGDIFIIPNSLLEAGHCDIWKNQIERALQTELFSETPLVQVWATSRDNENSSTPGTLITAREGVPLEKELTKEELKQACDLNWRTVHLGNKNTKAIDVAVEKSDNWACHGHPALGEGFIFPSALPYDLLKDKKEGDVFEITITNKQGEKVIASLQCKQNGYRYGEHRYGKNFEGWLTHLNENYTAKKLLTSAAQEYIYDMMKQIGAARILNTCRNGNNACKELFAKAIASQNK